MPTDSQCLHRGQANNYMVKGEMDPWGASERRPDNSELARLVSQYTDREIAEQFGVTRQAVAYWRAQAKISRGKAPRLSHEDLIPWQVRAIHSHDSIARRLRELSTIRQGGAVSDEVRRRVERFLAALRETNSVIDYDPERGFGTRQRDPEVDADDDIIRRPPVGRGDAR